MAGQLVPMWIGDVEVLVETVDELGSEDTSALDEAGWHVLGAVEKSHEVIVGAAVAAAVAKLGARAICPDKLEVEFDRGFSLKGNVIVVSGHAEAALKVKLTYDALEQG